MYHKGDFSPDAVMLSKGLLRRACRNTLSVVKQVLRQAQDDKSIFMIQPLCFQLKNLMYLLTAEIATKINGFYD